MLEIAALVAVVLLIVFAVRRLKEKNVKLPREDEGQRHHRGRGGGGLM